MANTFTADSQSPDVWGKHRVIFGVVTMTDGLTQAFDAELGFNRISGATLTLQTGTTGGGKVIIGTTTLTVGTAVSADTYQLLVWGN